VIPLTCTIELIRVGDDATEILIQKGFVRLDAKLELVAPAQDLQ
jgi:hypothetical protein